MVSNNVLLRIKRHQFKQISFYLAAFPPPQSLRAVKTFSFTTILPKWLVATLFQAF